VLCVLDLFSRILSLEFCRCSAVQGQLPVLYPGEGDVSLRLEFVHCMLHAHDGCHEHDISSSKRFFPVSEMEGISLMYVKNRIDKRHDP